MTEEEQYVYDSLIEEGYIKESDSRAVKNFKINIKSTLLGLYLRTQSPRYAIGLMLLAVAYGFLSVVLFYIVTTVSSDKDYNINEMANLFFSSFVVISAVELICSLIKENMHAFRTWLIVGVVAGVVTYFRYQWS